MGNWVLCSLRLGRSHGHLHRLVRQEESKAGVGAHQCGDCLDLLLSGLVLHDLEEESAKSVR